MIYFSAFGEKNIPDTIVSVNKVNAETISKQIFGLELNDGLIKTQSVYEDNVGVNTYNIGGGSQTASLCGVVYGLENKNDVINQLSTYTNAISYVKKYTKNNMTYHTTTSGDDYYLITIEMPEGSTYVDLRIWGRIELTEEFWNSQESLYETIPNVKQMGTQIRVNGEITEEHTDESGIKSYSMKKDHIAYSIEFLNGVAIFNHKITNIVEYSVGSGVTFIDIYGAIGEWNKDWSKKENIKDIEIYVEIIPRPPKI